MFEFHHEKRVHEHVKVESWEKIAFIFVEFPHEDLYRRHYNSVEKKYATNEEYSCQQQRMKNEHSWEWQVASGIITCTAKTVEIKNSFSYGLYNLADNEFMRRKYEWYS
jgi:hypothetical protein